MLPSPTKSVVKNSGLGHYSNNKKNAYQITSLSCNNNISKGIQNKCLYSLGLERGKDKEIYKGFLYRTVWPGNIPDTVCYSELPPGVKLQAFLLVLYTSVYLGERIFHQSEHGYNCIYVEKEDIPTPAYYVALEADCCLARGWNHYRMTHEIYASH